MRPATLILRRRTSLGGVLGLLVLALTTAAAVTAAPPPPRLDTPLWTRSFGTAGGDYGQAVIVGRDGSVYVAADLNVTPTGGQPALLDDVIVARYTAAGRLLWQRTIRAKTQQYVAGLAQGADGAILLVTWRSSDPGYSPADTYLYRLTPSGVVAGQRLLRKGLTAVRLVASGGGFFVSGYRYRYSGGPFVYKLDSAGRITWEAALDVAYVAYHQALAATPDGGAVFAADGVIDPNQDSPEQGLVVVRLDASGREIWRAADPLFGGWVDDVAVLGDGSIAVAATQWGDYGDIPTRGDQDVFVARYTAGGEPMWARTYGGADYDGAAGIAEVDDRLVIAGFTDSPRFEGPVADGTAFLLTLDRSGNRAGVLIFGVRADAMAVDERRIYLAGEAPSQRPGFQEDAAVTRVR